MLRCFAVTFLVFSWAFPSLAAEGKLSPEGEYSYEFEDDPLSAIDHRDYQTPIKVRKQRGRPTLIRPRYHFIRELEKSVEVL